MANWGFVGRILTLDGGTIEAHWCLVSLTYKAHLAARVRFLLTDVLIRLARRAINVANYERTFKSEYEVLVQVVMIFILLR
jgi:hypothetical protein